MTSKEERRGKLNKKQDDGGRALPGLKVIRQDLLVHVPSGKIMICREEGMVHKLQKNSGHIPNSKYSFFGKVTKNS